MDLYREQILDLYRNPLNYGEVFSPDLEASDLNPLCGDEVRIQARLSHMTNGLQSTAKIKKNHPIVSSRSAVVERVAFTGNGCAISQAAASMLTTMIKGKTLSSASKIEKEDLLEELGINPGPARIKCALLPLLVWKKALLMRKNGHA